MRNYKRFSLVTVLLMSAVAAHPQTNANLEQGFKPFGTYDESSFDSVSTTSHNLIVNIPLFDYPQRGSLHEQLKIYYTNKNYITKVNCTSSCVTYWSYNTVAPGGLQIILDDGAASAASKTFKDSHGIIVTTYAATTSDKAVHQLTGSVHGGYESFDTTGIWYNGNYSSPVLLNRGGTGFSQTWSQYGDTNGNFISSTDTIGRSFGTTSAGDTSVCRGPMPVTGATIYSYPGPGGTQSRQIQICNASLPAINTNFHAFSSQYGQLIREIVNSGNGNIQSIIAYDGQSWATSPQWIFEFNDADPGDPTGTNYGDLSKVTLPTGGTIRYTWAKWSNTAWCPDELTPMSRALTSRIVNANDGTGDHVTTYTFSSGNTGTTVTDASGNDTVHTGTGLNGSCTVYETQTDYYKGTAANGTLLKTVQTAYSSTSNPYDEYGDGTTTRANVVPTSVTTKYPLGGSNYLVTQVQTDYDSSFTVTDPSGNGTTGGTYRLMTEKREYGYAVNAPGALQRRSTYTYAALTNSNYLNANILDPVTQEIVKDGGGNQVAKTNYTYDGTTLQASGITMQHNNLANPGYRGNLTLVQEWLNTTGTMVTTKQTSYYDTGMPYQSFDLKGNATTYSYDPAYYGAYLTQTQYPNTGSGNSVTHIIQGAYDFNTGFLTSFTDQNNQTSNYSYDLLGRITGGTYPDGGAVTLGYVDSTPMQISKTVKVTTALNKVSNTVFDGLGRVSQTQFNDPDCTTGSLLVKTDHTYGFDSGQNTHFSTATTPYCDTPGTVYGMSTRSDSDALGRGVKATNTDSTVATSTYAPDSNLLALCTTVTDEAGKSRKTCSDGPGRMTTVWEDPAGLDYETDYTYDTLGNLTSVNQKGNDPNSANWRPRSFSYDSLSRLTGATNPEYANATSASNQSILYTYSNDSSGCSRDPNTICTKQAPTPNAASGTTKVTTTYTYDKLDRLTQKSYNDTPQTATVSHGYDGDTSTLTCANVPSLTDSYPKPERTAMCDGSGATAWGHDKMGRVLTEKRLINGSSAITKSVLYSYNLDGSLATLTYPSTRMITYSPNSSGSYTAGRSISAVDVANVINYVTAAKYAPQGALASLSNGAFINGALTYNSRLQPLQMYYTRGTISQTTLSQLQGSTCPTATATIMSTDYNFGLGTNDNGNIQAITNCRNTSRTENFVYDSLNRISQGYSSGSNWGEDFTIDPWGNLTNRSQHAGKTSYEPLAAPANTHNQLTGFGYDIAGNMIQNGTATYSYDAENRIISTAGYTYTYDGDGERVKKASGSTGTLYWKGTGSDPLAESNLSGTMQEEYIFFNGKRVARRDGSGGAVHYYFSDHLGSHGAVMNAGGGTCEQDIDYYPYGGAQQDYCSGSGVTQNYKFNGKERDNESGLDNFGARYDASNLGRFMTPDWDAKPVTVPYAKFGDPQSLNLYSYVENAPVNRLDPDGHGDPTSNVQGQTPCQDPTCKNQYQTNAANVQQDAAAQNASNYVVGALKEAGNTLINAVPGLNNFFSFDASNDAEAKGMTIAAIGMIVVPGGGEEEAAAKTESKASEVLTRFGKDVESAEKLGTQAAAAEANPQVGIHGVSTTARPNPRTEGSSAARSAVEKIFNVHNTGKDPFHRTVELPKPVTQAIADTFNRLFGRIP